MMTYSSAFKLVLSEGMDVPRMSKPVDVLGTLPDILLDMLLWDRIPTSNLSKFFLGIFLGGMLIGGVLPPAAEEVLGSSPEGRHNSYPCFASSLAFATPSLATTSGLGLLGGGNLS
jgi:hypothetical protein